MSAKTVSKVIIAGSRNFGDYDRLANACDKIIQEAAISCPVTIFSGGAMGTDHLGERYARERGYALRVFPADWGQYGKSAGPIRNYCMAREADMAICFWDGLSKGTRHMISVAKKKKMQVFVFII